MEGGNGSSDEMPISRQNLNDQFEAQEEPQMSYPKESGNTKHLEQAMSV